MKKHNMMRVASALAVVTLLSTSVISGTLAKYTSTASGSDTAKVAKWSILAGTVLNDITGTEPMKFDLFATVKDTGFKNEEEVRTAENTENSIIAPGTSGYVDLAIENQSDVAANYTITFSDVKNNVSTMGNVPLQFAVKKWDKTAPDSDSLTWYDSLKKLEEVTTGKLTTTDTDVKYRVYWKWDFGTEDGTNDSTDTTLGVNAQSTPAAPTITATVTATQAD